MFLPGGDATAVNVTGMRNPRQCTSCAEVFEQPNASSDASRCPACADQPLPPC
jgi:predicted Zn-ribbon and HTH transcriptional regulator